MKFVKTLILMVVCLAIGAGGGAFGGYKIGLEYGKKSVVAKEELGRLKQGGTFEVKPPTAAPAPAPAPAPVAAPTAAPVPTAAPAPAAPAATSNWEQVGTKSMSGQPVIELPGEEKAAAPATAAAPAPAASPAVPAPAPAPAAAPAGDGTVYAISPDDSTLDFTGYKDVMGDKIGMSGMFGEFSGTVNVPGDNLEQMSFDVSVKTDSIKTENPILTGVLKTSLFFDTAKYPEARLVSQKIEKRGEQYVAFVAWTMLDKTVGYEMPLTVVKTDKRITATCEQLIDRNKWALGPAIYENAELGISMPVLPDVKVKFEMTADKK
jgi:polyisoprenoid-binding protein YceI